MTRSTAYRPLSCRVAILDARIRCFHSPTVNSGYSKTAQGRDKMQEDKVRLADNEVKEGTACAAARLALAPLA